MHIESVPDRHPAILLGESYREDGKVKKRTLANLNRWPRHRAVLPARPVESHCMTPLFHSLPKSTRLWLVLHFTLGYFRKANTTHEAVRMIESARLLTKRNVRLIPFLITHEPQPI
jgi:hypothetical protein